LSDIDERSVEIGVVFKEADPGLKDQPKDYSRQD
jgi:hypothetical protein